jgi:hypothetical protein
MTYLTAEKQATQYFFRVQMDENPENVREFAWGLTPPEGQTETVYLANIKREIGLLVADELSRMNPALAEVATPLAGF